MGSSPSNRPRSDARPPQAPPAWAHTPQGDPAEARRRLEHRRRLRLQREAALRSRRRKLLLALLAAALPWAVLWLRGPERPDLPPPPPYYPATPLAVGSSHSAAEIASIVWDQPCQRPIHEVILHCTATPSAAEYRGRSTVRSVHQAHRVGRGWRNIGYHYLVAPDGTIWLGRPLADVGSHAQKHNLDTVGVALILDGDHELPTPAQELAGGILLKSLLQRFELKEARNFSGRRGFHRDYSDKTCPGRRISKEMVRGWIP